VGGRDPAGGRALTRVLHVQKVSGISGSEAHLLSALPLLRERGWDVRMLMLHEGEAGAREFARRLHVPVEAVRMRRDLDPRAFARVLRRLRALRPRIVHTHLVHGDVYGLPAAALLRVPLRVSTKHGFNEFRARPGFGRADRAVARLAHVDVAISRGLARYLGEVEGFDANRFEVVHYGIEPAGEPPPPPAEPRLLCIGRLIPIKGHALLLEAFRRARRELPGLTLELAGAGPLEAELRAAAGEGVTFLGQVAPATGAIERALAVVVPSLGEGFGMVALEAMERGRPVVASAVGGLPELVVHGETGLLVPPGDVDALAAALLEIARSPERARAMGAAGRLRAVEEFSAERCADRIDALYREALARR
jgi:glycosyltransferase involved in cell wall biosynthesis